MCQNPHACSHRDHSASSAGACTCGGHGHEPGALLLRAATVADVPVLLTLIGELAAFEGLHHEVEVTGPLLAKHLFGPGATARAIVAELGAGAAAGFAVWYPTFSTFLGRPGAFLEDLYVRPQFRRRGVGRQLLAAAGRQATEAGCTRFEWRALKWNDTALKFYQSLGAETLSEWLTLRLDAPKLFALPTAIHGATPAA